MSSTDSIALPPLAENLTGKVFGRLTVTRPAGLSESNRGSWVCVCACGAVRTVQRGHLLSGHTQSCGCLRADIFAANAAAKTPEHHAWAEMWNLCTNARNPLHRAYARHCPPEVWRDFFVFYRDVGPIPISGHVMERIDRAQGFIPGNVRWVAKVDQYASPPISVIHAGVKKWLVKACVDAKLSFPTTQFLIKFGQTPEEASNGVFSSVSV